MIFPVQTLENGTVLAVHRKDADSLFLRKGHDDMARCHKGFLVGQGDILSRFNRLNGGHNADHSHNGGYQDLSLGADGRLDEPLHARHNFHLQIRRPGSQLSGILLIPDRCQVRMKFPDLLLQFFDVPACRQSLHLYIFVGPDHIQGLGSDRTRRAKYRNLFHMFSFYRLPASTDRK